MLACENFHNNFKKTRFDIESKREKFFFEIFLRQV